MRYIRTNDGIYEKITVVRQVCDGKEVAAIKPDKVEFEPILKQDDNIEYLCDEFIYYFDKDYPHSRCYRDEFFKWYDVDTEHELTRKEEQSIKGAIWTEWGLKYVAKMNDKGELELL